MKTISLFYSDIAAGGSSDKEYNAQIVKQGAGYVVNFQYGRRGGTLQTGTKTNAPVELDEAERIFARLVAEKTNKGYRPGAGGATEMQSPVVDRISPSRLKDDPDAMEQAILEAQESRTLFPVENPEEVGRGDAERYIKSPDYIMQMKADGHRRQIQKSANGITGYNKKGERVPLPAQVVDAYSKINLKTFFIDGELVGQNHIAFDLLMANGVSVAKESYEDRFAKLVKAVGNKGGIVTCVATWAGTAQKQAALAQLFKNRAEGVVFKLRTAPYRAGIGSHRKFKFLKMLSCYVTAVNVGGKSNATIALKDADGIWREIGGVSTIGKGPIRPGMIVEVVFLHATAGKQLFQPRIKEVREDVRVSECTMKRQLKPEMYKEGVAA